MEPEYSQFLEDDPSKPKKSKTEYFFPEAAERKARGELPPNPGYNSNVESNKAKKKTAQEAAAKGLEAAKKAKKSKTNKPKKATSKQAQKTLSLPDPQLLNTEMTGFYESGDHDTPSEYCTNGCTVNNLGTNWNNCLIHKRLLDTMS